MSESAISHSIRFAFGARDDTRLFRNNVGRLRDKEGRYVQFGLCPGSADLIGWHTLTITADMVGSRIAVFAAIESKKPGARTDPERLALQQSFIDAVNRAGGLAGFATSLDEAAHVLRLPS